MIELLIPADSAAVAVGADAVAGALTREAERRGLEICITRTGTRGMLWLEPLVEVEIGGARVAYGPVTPGDVPGLLDAGMLDGAPHALRIGPPEAHAYMAGQTRVTFERVGRIDPLSLTDFRASGGFEGLARARSLGPDATRAQCLDPGGTRARATPATLNAPPCSRTSCQIETA